MQYLQGITFMVPDKWCVHCTEANADIL